VVVEAEVTMRGIGVVIALIVQMASLLLGAWFGGSVETGTAT
jgi:hypothetical protein